MTTKKSTKKTKKANVPCGPSKQFDLERFKNMVIVALLAVIIGLTAAFAVGVHNMRIMVRDAKASCETVEE